jgi:uncharacterized protein (TIGR01370 family)
MTVMTTPENGIYVLQGIVPADIAAAPVGVKVVDLYDDNGQLFTSAQVAQMEGGGGLLLGYFSIGEAEDYRSYFSSLPESVLGPVDPSWPGDYEVAYWTPTWWTVCTNYIDQMITLGYQGAFLDVVGECETSWAQANAPGGDAKGAMVSLVEKLAAYARAQDPSFQMWVNISGAEDLATNSTFINSINGAYEEEMFYKDNGSLQSTADINYNIYFLTNLLTAGKPVVAVEYVSGASAVTDVKAKAAAAGVGYYVANPNLSLDGVDIDGFACYLRGTLILTDRGEVAVEELTIGDAAITLSGAARPIKWIGRRAFDGRFIAGKREVLPIRLAAGALADRIPARDLWISPGHALYVDGVLVQAEHLVNGATIAQAENAEQVEYFHIELETHDVIFAEGAPAESYVECDNRAMFQNAGEFTALYSQDERLSWQYCAPRLEWHSAELTAIRTALLERAKALGHGFDTDPDLRLIVDGKIIRPDSIDGSVYRFDIPAGSAAVSLASRSAVPAEVDASSRDNRRLGVPVERITLREAGVRIEVEHGHPSLCDGFHEDEEGHRWTDGLARLPGTWLRPLAGAITLDVCLVSSELPYRLDPSAEVARIAAGTSPARTVRRQRRVAG